MDVAAAVGIDQDGQFTYMPTKRKVADGDSDLLM